jgi:hypothetical protein
MLVVVLRVPGQDPPEVPVAEDQQVVEALAAQRSRYSVPQGNSPGVTGPVSG